MILKIPTNYGSTKNSSVDRAPEKIMQLLKGKWKQKEIVVPEDVLERQEKIEKNVPNNYFIALGGDHSITYPLIKGTNRKPFLVMMDAHPDCEKGFENVTHEDFLKRLIENDLVSGVAIIGLRKWSTTEWGFMKKNNIIFFTPEEIMQKGIAHVTEDVVALINKREVYLSIDIDCLDPAFAPGTTFSEPGGLTTRELLYFVKKMKNLKIIGSDIVEIDPDKDINNATLRIGSLLLEILSKH